MRAAEKSRIFAALMHFSPLPFFSGSFLLAFLRLLYPADLCLVIYGLRTESSVHNSIVVGLSFVRVYGKLSFLMSTVQTCFSIFIALPRSHASISPEIFYNEIRKKDDINTDRTIIIRLCIR